jgi:hypothetical protein
MVRIGAFQASQWSDKTMLDLSAVMNVCGNLTSIMYVHLRILKYSMKIDHMSSQCVEHRSQSVRQCHHDSRYA